MEFDGVPLLLHSAQLASALFIPSSISGHVSFWQTARKLRFPYERVMYSDYGCLGCGNT